MWVQALHILAQWLTMEMAWKIGRTFTQCHNVIISEYGSRDGRYVKMLINVELSKPLISGTNIRYEGEKC